MASTHINTYYSNGVIAMSQKDYISARNCFQLSSSDKFFREKSLYYLIFIEIIESKYKTARELLGSVKDITEAQHDYLSGYLDTMEYNFLRSKSFHEKSLSGDFAYSSLFQLSDININLGNFLVAEKILESIRFNPDYYIKATLDLIALKIREKDYEGALGLVNQLDKNTLNNSQIQYLEKYEKIILYNLGKLEISDDNKGKGTYYIVNRLTQDGDKELIKHVKEHVHPEDKRDVFYFFRYTDIKYLLDICKNRIQSMNPSAHEVTDIYLFRMEDPVGVNKGELTSDICVKTFNGTDKIITMYPVKLSSEFDIEGMSTSEELQHKLKLGGGY